MKLSSLRRGWLIQFDCYGAHYFARVIGVTKDKTLYAAYRSCVDHDRWIPSGAFDYPTNISKSSVKPPKGFELLPLSFYAL